MNASDEYWNNIDGQVDYTARTPRFSVKNDETLNAGLAYLDEHGYVVISDVLDEDEINVNKDLLWKFIENSSNGAIQRDDPETWSNNWPSYKKHGVINGSGIGTWNTEELLVSFDGCNVFRDWRYNPSWKTVGGWNHVDQNPKTKPNRCCVQGFVSLTDQSEKTGGLVVYPKTHLRFTELSDAAEGSRNFVKILDTHPIMDQGRTRGKLVHCRAGDMVLWDSRTVHSNSPATAIDERHEDEPVDLLRIVAYVSMSPTAFVKGQTLAEFREKRKQIVENNCTLSHWSTEIVVAGGINTGLPKLSLDSFNAHQKALILGLDE